MYLINSQLALTLRSIISVSIQTLSVASLILPNGTSFICAVKRGECNNNKFDYVMINHVRGV